MAGPLGIRREHDKPQELHDLSKPDRLWTEFVDPPCDRSTCQWRPHHADNGARHFLLAARLGQPQPLDLATMGWSGAELDGGAVSSVRQRRKTATGSARHGG